MIYTLSEDDKRLLICGGIKMTLPSERTRAVIQTERFLMNLVDSQVTPGLPKSLRQEARGLLRHYPQKHEIEMVVAGWNEPTVRFTFECPFGKTDEL